MPSLLSKVFFIALLVSGLSACTNNPFAWKLLYGQFDTFLNRQLLRYADFSDSQKRQIRTEVNKTVEWHRQNELPKYVFTISEFQQRFLLRDSMPSIDDITWLVDEMDDIALRFDQNSTLLALIPLLSNVTDKQVAQIAETIDQEFKDNEKEWEKEAGKDPAVRSAKNIRKFLKRLGLSINKQQYDKLTKALTLRQLDRQTEQVIWREWSNQLIDILESRSEAGFAQKFTDHHFARSSLLQNKQAEKWAHDHALYKNMMLDLLRGIDDRQKKSMNERLNQFKEVATQLNTP